MFSPSKRDALRVGDHRRSAAEELDLVGVGGQRQARCRQVDNQGVGRAVIRELAGQVDVFVDGRAGLPPKSTRVTVLAVIVLGSIGPLKVMLIDQGVSLRPAVPPTL